MARANRHHILGKVWRITHHCHKKEFLLKFARDRRWRYFWLFKAKKRFGLSILQLCCHFQPYPSADTRHGTGYNPEKQAVDRRKDGLGVQSAQATKRCILGRPYHATAVEQNEHLIRCLVNIDLNMVRATASPTQLAVAEFLTNGGYDHHLRKIRRIYARQTALVRDTVMRHFQAGTRVSRPEGGFILWVELPEGFSAYKLYEAALRGGIGIALAGDIIYRTSFEKT